MTTYRRSAATTLASVPCRPYTETWIQEVLTPFARHYQDLLEHPSNPEATVLRMCREELLHMVIPFVRAEYNRRSRDLPSHADVHALEEAMFDAAMRACLNFNPGEFISWPALLKAKMMAAPVEAARVDSKISRRHAKYQAAFVYREEALVQELGRTLSPEERHVLAEDVAPATRRENWPVIVQQSFRVTQIESLPDEGRAFEDLTTLEQAAQNLQTEELHARLAEVLSNLSAEVRTLFIEELERVRDGKEPRRQVVKRLNAALPQHLRLFLA